MATKKPRLTITFDPELYDLVSKLSDYHGISKSKLVNSYLVQLKPHLTELVKAFELIEDKKDPTPLFRNMIIDAQQHLLNISKEVNDD